MNVELLELLELLLETLLLDMDEALCELSGFSVFPQAANSVQSRANAAAAARMRFMSVFPPSKSFVYSIAARRGFCKACAPKTLQAGQKAPVRRPFAKARRAYRSASKRT